MNAKWLCIYASEKIVFLDEEKKHTENWCINCEYVKWRIQDCVVGAGRGFTQVFDGTSAQKFFSRGLTSTWYKAPTSVYTDYVTMLPTVDQSGNKRCTYCVWIQQRMTQWSAYCDTATDEVTMVSDGGSDDDDNDEGRWYTTKMMLCSKNKSRREEAQLIYYTSSTIASPPVNHSTKHS